MTPSKMPFDDPAEEAAKQIMWNLLGEDTPAGDMAFITDATAIVRAAYAKQTAELNQFRADNDMLRKMLILVSHGNIGLRCFAFTKNILYGPLINNEPVEVVNETYDDPIEALEAAYAEWKKRNEN